MPKNTKQSLGSVSPREFLKARRPERFSDSLVDTKPVLDRSRLEYHLDSLTSRSQETDFARFVHRLCEIAICPNLLPQTGPTGGGDSKVDAETYPVADTIALGWYEGEGRTAASERWAFAISAKKKWKAKVESDVAKAVATGRGYAKVHFVTNQFVPDKKRAELEDELRTRHGIDVRILDRTWILNEVFKRRLELLAIEELKVGAQSISVPRPGPRDSQRERHLEIVENRITAALSQGRTNSVLVDDVLEVAETLCALDRPRGVVEGAFMRAIDVARRFGSLRQQIEASYQLAWATFFWFEDAAAFVSRYPDVEGLVKASDNPYDVELLSNLWKVLFSAARIDDAVQSATVDAHRVVLVGLLESLVQDENRPTASLRARAMLCELRLLHDPANAESAAEQLRALEAVVREVPGHVGFPFDPLVAVISELGNHVGDSPAFESLHESIVEAVRQTKGDAAAAAAWVDRGEAQLRSEKPANAIASVGRALVMLATHESRFELARALYLIAGAYDQLGLPWASRSALLHATAVCVNDLYQYGAVHPGLVLCARRLKWLELQLGRVPQTLDWYQIEAHARAYLAEKRGEQSDEDSTVDAGAFEYALGYRFLRAERHDLPLLGALPSVLEHLGLEIAAATLACALGYPDKLTEWAAIISSSTTFESFVERWISSDVPDEFVDRTSYGESPIVVLETRVLGTVVTVHCERRSPAVDVGESLLGMLEALMATAANARMVVFASSSMVRVSVADESIELVSQEVVDGERGREVVLTCGVFSPHSHTRDQRTTLLDAVFRAAVAVLATFVRFGDDEKMESLFRDERAHDRALQFGGTMGVVSAVLGNAPRTTIADWTAGEAEVFAVRGEGLPVPGRRTIAQADGEDRAADQVEFDFSQTSHARMRVESVIRIDQWDRARWTAVLFATVEPVDAAPPILALGFKDPEAGRLIFEGWRQEFGDDLARKLRVSIVRGVDRSHPQSYRVVIGSKPDGLTTGNLVYTVARICQMDPPTSANLERFLAAYRVVRRFQLAHAVTSPDGRADGARIGMGILLDEILIRDAWTIEPNDLDVCAIRESDDPIVPDGVDDVPVRRTLSAVRARRR